MRPRREHLNQEEKPFPLPVFLQDPLLARSNIVPTGKGEFRADKH